MKRYKLLKQISEGAYSEVYEAINMETGKKAAVK